MKSKEFKRKSILFVHTSFSSFVKNDYCAIASTHTVEKYHFAHVKGLLNNAFQIFRQLLFLMIFGWKYDIFYCWFADYHSFIPVLFAKIFRKKSIIVIGGYDVCRIRNLKYGTFFSPFRGWFCANSMRLSNLILPVSGFVERKAKVIAPKTKRTMIYNCVTLESPAETLKFKTDTILTVGIISNERTFFLKGIDTFIETARLLPEFRFEIVGINQSGLEEKLRNFPVNISLYSQVKPEELTDFYLKARIYCQLSRSESFGVSIAEAMTFGAFPIVTNEGGMPEVVGTVGTVIKRDPQLIANLIKEKILRGENESEIKMQVQRHFTRQQRTDSLLLIINNL